MKRIRAVWSAVCALAWVGPLHQSPAGAAPGAHEGAEGLDEFAELPLQQLVDRGVAAYEAGRFEQADSWLQRALARHPPRPQRARLLYNLGASQLQRQHWGAAESLFVEAAQLSEGEERSIARLQAGFSALAAGAVERAEKHCQSVTEFGEQSRVLAKALRERLSDAAATADGPAPPQHRLEQGYALLGTNDFKRAKTLFQEVLAEATEASVRADAAYGLALAAERRGRWNQAEGFARQALVLDASRWEALWLLGSVSHRRGDLPSAVLYWSKALQFELPDGARRRMVAALAALDPRPASGLFGYGQWGVGYDSNATQAGAAVNSGLSTAAIAQQQPSLQERAEPSAQSQMSLLVGHTLRLWPAWWLRSVAQTSHWALLRSSAQQASVGQVDAALEVGHWVTSSLQFSGRAFGGHSRTGLSGGTPFVSFAGLSGEGKWQASSNWQFQASVEYQRLVGHETSAALTGDRIGLQLEDSFFGEGVDVGLRLGGLIYWAGKQSVVADPAVLPLCSRVNAASAAICQFEVPLSFRELSASLSAGYETVFDVSLRGEIRAEARDFWQPSQLVVGPAARTWPGSEKQRQDLGVRVFSEVGWSPPRIEPVTVWWQYQGRLVRSNLQPDRRDPEHRFDYEDRNYTQHSVLFGARFHWDER